ncbi:unnamed protein product [Adineta steineri]|uniref:SWIM-type domain-containing protein n=1 Tax=Adineta steineri TaxID=433720 RepID=A0A814MUR6_9BILA|nr:unnamed protein product [Adineta steineri]CAF3484511.1 unnamed protein product [Adineta steineri]
MGSMSQLEDSETHENIYPSPLENDTQLILSSSSSSSSADDDLLTTNMLTHDQQIIFDKALGEMLTRHFYLIQHEFLSPDHFEGWIYTYNRHRYKIIISYYLSCSCKNFRKNFVCKHFLFVLKRIFNVNLYSFDIRLSIMQYHQFTSIDLEDIFQGQVRRLCPIVTPLIPINKKEKLSLTLKRQSIDYTDVCPICFESLLMKNRKLVTCFYSCGKSMHKHCMNEWKRVQGKSINCPLCQAHWIDPSTAEKAVLTHYSHRSYPLVKREKYILCCLYTPPDWL